jgi:hypothetical protein
MKTQMKPILWALTLMALFSAPNLASAYYDPGIQRWINRDPVADESGLRALPGAENQLPQWFLRHEGLQNQYSFVRSSPLCLVDSDGRVVIVIGGAGGAVVTIGQGVTIGLAVCYIIPSCRAALERALAQALDKAKDICRPPRQNRDRERCPLEDQHDMGPVAGYRCEYWCRKSGARPVIYVPHAEGGCPKYIEQ